MIPYPHIKFKPENFDTEIVIVSFILMLLKTDIHISGCPLESLNISENQLTKKCLQSLLENVSGETLKHLDISQCLQEEAHRISLESVLSPIASHDLCCLQNLSLAGCHLSREDVLGVIRYCSSLV